MNLELSVENFTAFSMISFVIVESIDTYFSWFFVYD